MAHIDPMKTISGYRAIILTPVPATNPEWSPSHYDVQHLGKAGDERWCTVSGTGPWVLLLRYFPGCGLKPLESTHEHLFVAKSLAEQWVNKIDQAAA